MIVNLSLMTWKKRTHKWSLESIFKSKLRGGEPIIPRPRLGTREERKSIPQYSVRNAQSHSPTKPDLHLILYTEEII